MYVDEEYRHRDSNILNNLITSQFDDDDNDEYQEDKNRASFPILLTLFIALSIIAENAMLLVYTRYCETTELIHADSSASW